MEEDIFRRKLKNPAIEETIMPIFDFFEQYIDSKSNSQENEKVYSDDEILTIYEMLVEQKILDKISSLRSKISSDSYTVAKSFVLSFQQNTSQFVASEKFRSRVKWKKILNSYVNVSRILLEGEKLQSLLAGLHENQRLILAMSLIDPQDDKIKADAEIQRICELFESDPDIIVIPIHGCTTNVFKTILEKIPRINMLHLAGHTCTNSRGEVLMSFVDSNMTFGKYSNWISSHIFEVSFYNCCSTLEFVRNHYSLNSMRKILHSGKVGSQVAYNFSEDFYSSISAGQDFNMAWSTASGNCNESPMNYLLF
ncbi:TPA: hypothetical protein U2B31_002007 [Streptococcus suis]|nr:hypothetical protein [Streptococcus suis]